MTKGRKPSRSARKSADVKAVGQEVKEINAEVKALRKQAKDLLKKSNLSVREFRHNVAELKKAGVVSSRVDARSQRVTKYMLAKQRKFADVLRGETLVVKPKRDVFERYKETGQFETRGRLIVLPKTHERERARIREGKIEVVKPLKNGEQQTVYLPFKVENMEQLAAELIARGDGLDSLRKRDEQFGGTLFGGNLNQGIGFPDAQELGEFILQNYRHLFSGKAGREAIKHFKLVRFKRNQMKDSDELNFYKDFRPANRKWRNLSPDETRWIRQKRLDIRADAKAAKRAAETPEQRETRLAKQRIRTAQNKQRKFLEK